MPASRRAWLDTFRDLWVKAFVCQAQDAVVADAGMEHLISSDVEHHFKTLQYPETRGPSLPVPPISAETRRLLTLLNGNQLPRVGTSGLARA
jgi:hypothetical protein